MDIEEILQKHDLVYVDTSALHPNKNVHRKAIAKNGHTYTKLDDENLEGAIETVDSFLNIIDNQKVRVIPEVVGEIGSLQSFICRIMDYRKKQQRYKHLRDEVSVKDHQLRALEQKVYAVIRLAKISKAKVNRHDFNILAEVTSTITRSGRLKRDNIDKECMAYNDTDERLIAHAIYSSMFEYCNTGVITMDSDLNRILKTTTRFITSGFMGEAGKAVSARLDRMPVTLYFVERNAPGYTEIISTSHLNRLEYCFFANLSRLQNKQLNDSILQLLSRLNLGSANANQAYSN